LSKTAAATPVPDEDDMTEDEVRGTLLLPELPLIWRQFVSSRPTVMMFHGNGGNHGHRIPLAKVFYLRMRCNVLMVSYRG
jgi:hypothetical protein